MLLVKSSCIVDMLKRLDVAAVEAERRGVKQLVGGSSQCSCNQTAAR